MLETPGQRIVVVGGEVKASVSITQGDFSGLRELANAAGKAFARGVVLYTVEQPMPFEESLEVGSGTQAEQSASIMVRYERLLLQSPSDLCLVVGDVTSTMACAITAQKLRVPVAHVEGGIRSGDWGTPP